MELDDLKHTWKETSMPAQNHHALHSKTLEELTGQHYRSTVRKIMIPELAGSVVCLAAAAFIGLRFSKLDTGLLQAAGILSILLLLVLPLISTISTWKLRRVGNVNKPYAATLQSFAVQKIRFIQWQKLNVILSYLLLVSIIVLLSRQLSGKAISGLPSYWLFSFTIGFILLLFYSKWVAKYYRKSLQQAEELLKEFAA